MGITAWHKIVADEKELRKKAAERERNKINKDNARKQLEKSLLAGDQGLVRTVYGAWISVAKNLKLQKAKKDQSTAVAMRAIANSQNAVVDFCITAWHKIVKEEKEAKTKAQERDRALANKENARKQLQKSLIAGDKGLMNSVYGAWKTVA